MPATQVSPSLRRRLSDDARELLRLAFDGSYAVPVGSSGSPTSAVVAAAVSVSPNSVKHLSLAERLQNFRGLVRLELPDVGESACVRLRIAVSDASYVLRYQVESLGGAEVSVFNKAGSITSWITATDGQHTQLRTFLHATSSPRDACAQIASLVDILEVLDLFDAFRAALSAQATPLSPRHGGRDDTFRAMSDKNAYAFAFDLGSGRPVMVTQSARISSVSGTYHQSLTASSPKKLRMVVEDYVRSDGVALEPPLGIKSDVELMVDTAMTCFSQWGYDSQQRAMQIFDAIDNDSDGSISGEDVYEQLVAAGQSEHQSSAIVLEMTRLLCDSADPAEEFAFYKFCGFWITMLADGYRVSDPANESSVLAAIEALFLGMRGQ